MSNPYHAIILYGVLRPDGRVFGQVFCDKKGRFKDGEEIITSPLLDPPTKPLDGVWLTKNSAYYVHWTK